MEEQVDDPNVLEALRSYDWMHAFAFASGVNEHGNTADPSCPDWAPGEPATGAAPPATRSDVVELLGSYETPPDGSYYDLEMLLLARLRDGRWLFLSAGCDTTGWGCQDGGRSFCATSRERIEMCITAGERERLAIDSAGASE